MNEFNLFGARLLLPDSDYAAWVRSELATDLFRNELNRVLGSDFSHQDFRSLSKRADDLRVLISDSYTLAEVIVSEVTKELASRLKNEKR